MTDLRYGQADYTCDKCGCHITSSAIHRCETIKIKDKSMNEELNRKELYQAMADGKEIERKHEMSNSWLDFLYLEEGIRIEINDDDWLYRLKQPPSTGLAPCYLSGTDSEDIQILYKKQVDIVFAVNKLIRERDEK